MSVDFDPGQHPHRRLNALTGEWVLVSPHRIQRPWQGQTEVVTPPAAVPYDAHCYLCPGNQRAGGHQNPTYSGTYVFENDFAALRPLAVEAPAAQHPLLHLEPEAGLCRVVCFSPRHDLTLSRMPSLDGIVDTWVAQYRELAAIDWVRSVIIFENRGEMMGSSNAHPHGQIWANRTLPTEVAKEDASQREYFSRTGRPLLADYLAEELRRGDRIVATNDEWIVLVPFWAVWPFETLLLPRRPVHTMADLDPAGREGLGVALQTITRAYDRLFDAPFPYTMGFHQQPSAGWTLHAHFYPPLLRSATVRKFMVGYEMLGLPQRDITPEWAAARLRDLI